MFAGISVLEEHKHGPKSTLKCGADTKPEARTRNNGGDMARSSGVKEKGITERCVLTCTQRKMIRMLAEGPTRKEICGLLGISIHTVNSYLERIYRKLGAHNASEATAKAIKKGLLSNTNRRNPRCR